MERRKDGSKLMRISGTIFPNTDGEEFMDTELVAAGAIIHATKTT
tara:strand:+ start:723 stop:857 length:135 start_codon:yes stop_codon:yes gene_type:complete